jgi:hypothetical protein
MEYLNAVFLECKTCPTNRNISQPGLGGSEVLQNLPAEDASNFEHLLLRYPFNEVGSNGLYQNYSDLSYTLGYRTILSTSSSLLDDFTSNVFQFYWEPDTGRYTSMGYFTHKTPPGNRQQSHPLSTDLFHIPPLHQ